MFLFLFPFLSYLFVTFFGRYLFIQDTDGMTAVDLHLDDDSPQPSVPAKLSFTDNVDVNDLSAPSSYYSESQIEIVIKEFEKKGEGMGAYIVYKIVTTVSMNFSHLELKISRLEIFMYLI